VGRPAIESAFRFECRRSAVSEGAWQSESPSDLVKDIKVDYEKAIAQVGILPTSESITKFALDLWP